MSHAHVHVHAHVNIHVHGMSGTYHMHVHAGRGWLQPTHPARNLTDHLPPACRLGVIADLRVGNQRLGPSKSRRLHRILMATRSQAEDNLVP